jgi:hypothetical protein
VHSGRSPLKFLWISIILHGITSQKIVLFTVLPFLWKCLKTVMDGWTDRQMKPYELHTVNIMITDVFTGNVECQGVNWTSSFHTFVEIILIFAHTPYSYFPPILTFTDFQH